MKAQNKRLFILIILLLVLTMTACNSSEGISANTEQDELVSGEELGFLTSFENLDDWKFYSAYDLDDYEVGNSPLGISISMNHPDDIITAYLNFWYSDVSINTYMIFSEGDADLTFEVVCRSYNDSEYIFAFDMQQYYYVWYYELDAEEYMELDKGQSEFSNVNGANSILVDCIGNRLDFTINGAKVSSIFDDKLEGGYVGFAVETYGEGTALVYFSYFDAYSR